MGKIKRETLALFFGLIAYGFAMRKGNIFFVR